MTIRKIPSSRTSGFTKVLSESTTGASYLYKRAAQCVLLTKGFWLRLSMASTSERLSLPMIDLVEASTTEVTWQSQGISYIVCVAPLNEHIISPGSEKPLRDPSAFEDCADLQG